MNLVFYQTAIGICLWLVIAPFSSSLLGDDSIDFNRDIRPILSENCIFCHGPDDHHRQADLRLDEADGAHAGAIVPGQPSESEFMHRILAEDEEMRMPPVESGKKLTPQEIELLKKWISQGANYEMAWAYASPKRISPPEVKNKDWPTSLIDRYLLAKMESEGLAPAPRADKVTLLRRLSFDLTGLPPTPEEVDAFVNDDAPNAFEKQVDRLLATDHFGERMAVYWLDLVRYADTVGYHGDQDHNISPYRDYVLDAFNDNMPFDQFTREQLAGDLLPEPTIDQRIATGYNRLLQTTHEGGLQPKEYLAIYAADRVRNLSAVWMGATVGCAQCHSHKYDPYTIGDFYSLAAFFADVDEARHFQEGSNRLPTNRPPEIAVRSKRERRRLAELESQLAARESGEEANSASKQELAAIRKEIQSLQRGTRMTMVTQAIEPREMRILPRGNWLDDSGEMVEPAIPEFMGEIDTSGERATRLDLANWLVDEQHGAGGLTARVYVNRLWYLFFGVGIASRLDDFGGQGEPPIHPELLDYLALEFCENDWDVKRIVKQIVMTSAYAQASTATELAMSKDPYNRLVSHQARHRLPAEMVRDNALAVSGLLNRDYGGPSVRPYQPEGYYRHLNFPTRTYKADEDARQWRRGVYVHWQRQFLHPALKSLDAPSREECTAQRARSNTPLAALALLNDPTFVEAAKAFAEKIVSEGGEKDKGRLNFAFREALSRLPTDRESTLLLDVLQQNRQYYQDQSGEAERLMEVGLYRVPDDIPTVELAAWTQVARVLFNIDEFITRN